MDPNDPENYWVKATALVWGGRAKEAINPVQLAMRLDPHFPARYMAILGITKFALNRFEEAAADLARAVGRRDDDLITLLHLVSAYGYLGRTEEARQALAQLNAMRPKHYPAPVTLWIAKESSLYKNKADQNRLISGLRLAGVPDNETTRADAGAQAHAN
jgi:tetratricopeptide (TPR) repeat protein